MISKALEVDPYFFTREDYPEWIINGNVKGLGAVQIAALWVQEIDFKAGNVVVSNKDEVIKLDGGLCFSDGNNYVPGTTNFNITAADLEALPLLATYTPYHWLDAWKYYNEFKTTDLDSSLNSNAKSISGSSHFRQEINQTILRIICLPKELIACFVRCYAPNDEIASRLIDILLNRQQQLKDAAYATKSFKSYMESEESKTDLIKFVQDDLKPFKTMGKSVLLTDIESNEKINIENYIYKKFIKGYAFIKIFFEGLDQYANLLRDLSSNNPNLYTADHKQEINGLILKLKEIITEYFKSPTLDKYRALHDTLKDVRHDLIKFNLPSHDQLIASLDKLMNQLDGFAKGAPIPPPKTSLARFFKARERMPTMEEPLFGSELSGSNNPKLRL